MTASFIIAILALCFQLVQAQYGSYTGSQSPYAPLRTSSTDQTFEDQFTWPTGPGANVFDQGSLMNITWITDYDMVNLDLIINNHWYKRVSLATNLNQKYFEWTVDCHYKCAGNPVPFTFHMYLVNGGSGGFWSRHFWIKPSPASVSSVDGITTTSTTTSTTSSMTLTNTSSKSRTTHNTATRATQSSSRSASIRKYHAGDNSVAIGAGVGVCAGVLLLGLGAFFLWRFHRRKRRSAEPQFHYSRSSAGWYDQDPTQAETFSAMTSPAQATHQGGECDPRFSPFAQELPERIS